MANTLVYGGFSTSIVGGSFDIIDENGVFVAHLINLASTEALSVWHATGYSIQSQVVSVDSQGNTHATINAIVIYTGGQYNLEGANAVIDITIFTTGVQTIGMSI